eukprot:CAMPEP_0177584202 /NCGR_PEP_ID=MMETSP0419_2-20121207/3769_1 /TAXON_ID=582737 /ORGANISM="Tetraselmis sp., Strain GSL018" /LENGTH=201 /DNA_ID=CAMNT_0019073723 /DNA_START=229 /DNA_END=831 /DNA_ORIENTATION=+
MVIGTKCPEISGLDFIKGQAHLPPEDSPAIIELWASWCGPCRQVFPHLSEIARRHRPKGLVVVGVTSEPKAQVQGFVQQMGASMDYSVASDARGDCQRKLAGPAGVRGIPHAFVVGADGTIRFSGHPLDPGFASAVDGAVAEAAQRRVPEPITATRAELEAMGVRELKRVLIERGIPLAGLAEKSDIVDKVLEACTAAPRR